METERIIDKFVKEVRENEGSFSLEMKSNDGGKYHYYFLQTKVGENRLIYGDVCYNNALLHLSPYTNFSLAALVTKEGIYIVNEILFDSKGRFMWNLPENTFYLEDVLAKKNYYLKTTFIPQVYDRLPIEEFAEGSYEWSRCRFTAKYNKLRGIDYLLPSEFGYKEPVVKREFPMSDLIEVMCGLTTWEDIAMKRIVKPQERKWILRKSNTALITKFMEDDSLIEPYEQEIADALIPLKETTVHFVTVEFEKNGLRASGKIDCTLIIHAICECKPGQVFYFHSFVTREIGREIMNTLRINNTTDFLRLEDISRITYRNKVLYQKK